MGAFFVACDYLHTAYSFKNLMHGQGCNVGEETQLFKDTTLVKEKFCVKIEM